jgi:dCMP deaminase
MRTDIPKWAEYYMGFAEHAARKSKDSTQVGAVLVGPDGEVRLTAYNGPPRGVDDLPERFERPAKYKYASHSEQNLIAFAARQGIRTEGCSVFVTHMPCSACARMMIQAGVKTIIYGPGQTMMEQGEFDAAWEMLSEAGLTVLPVPMAVADEVGESYDATAA